MRLSNLTVTIVFILVFSVVLLMAACAPAPAVIYQTGVPGQSGAVGTGGIIVSQQSLGLWVNGEGKATGTPDIVILTLGVQSQDKTVAIAQKAAIEAMNNIMQVLKSTGIADKDIQTTRYNIEQLTRWDEKENTYIVVGYQISNMVTVKIRDMNKAGDIIDKAAEKGGDLIRITGISFTIEDPNPLLKIAREKAILNAMDKAKQMSQASSVKLGKLIYISDSTSSIPRYENAYMKLADSRGIAAAPTPISAGELEYVVNVQLVYQLD